MVKAKELRNQSEAELQALYYDLSSELFELRNQMKVTRKLEKPHLLKAKKKDRARVMTVLSQKQMKLGN
ncbi:MAG: ribosomal protein [Chlamydiota bacterium]|jgi:large subunit ribosomal protein L29